MKSSQPITIYRDNKPDLKANVSNYSLWYFDRFAEWFNEKSGASAKSGDI